MLTSLGLEKLIHIKFYYFLLLFLIYLAIFNIKLLKIVNIRVKIKKARIFNLVNIKKNSKIFKLTNFNKIW